MFHIIKQFDIYYPPPENSKTMIVLYLLNDSIYVNRYMDAVSLKDCTKKVFGPFSPQEAEEVFEKEVKKAEAAM